MIERDWNVLLPRLARVAHNAHMADEWDDLPADGIERAIWLQTVAAVVNDLQAIMNEWDHGRSPH